MRRVAIGLVSLGVLAAACSFEGGVDVDTEPPPDGRPDAIEGDAAAGGDGGAVVATPDDDGVVALPGLLDPSNEVLPDDPAVRTGTLANGLRYYIRANDNPGGKAELRLAVGAGSVDEFGASTGVAHFVEHMLFNGTDRFPENELIDVLRSFGAAFGADINAYTSFDETVYSLTVPNAGESLETGMTVLEQWLSHATFDPDQVVAERGVVLDEWRVRTQSARGRLFDVAADMYLADSPYADRTPIGTDESISAMGADELREYYDTWYRPDNAAVVVVGEIDVDDVEADIERLFGPAGPRTDRESAPAETSVVIGVDAAVGLHVDPDQQTVDVEVTLPLLRFETSGTAEARASFIDAMISDALVRRLDQDLAAGRAPFDRVTRGGNDLVDPLDAPALYAFTDVDRVTETLQGLLDEYERANRFGFTEAETDTARENLRSYFTTRFEGRDSAQDRDYADEYVDDFLSGGGFPAIEVEFEYATRILDRITPEALHQRFRARWTNTAPHVIISAPEAVAADLPSEAEILTTIAAAAKRDVEPRERLRDLPAALMDRPAAVEPASAEELLPFDDPFLDPIELEYPNGVRVILNTNGIVEGQVFFRAASPGGSSLVADEDVVDALYAADVAASSGVADFNQAEVAQITAGSDVEITAWITPYLENFAGSAATADVEVLLQLVHLSMTRPRFDQVALDQVRSRVGPSVADPGSDPRAAGEQAVAIARYGDEPRYARLPDPDEFATLDLDGIERVWNARFGNAADWVFVFAGDFDIDAVSDLADAYLGTLPATEREQWVDVEQPPPGEVVRSTVRAGTGQTASLTVLFTSPLTSVDEAIRVNADVVTEVIGARLTDEVRERLGESYSPSAYTYVTTDPDPAIETSVTVTGSPDRIETIAELVVEELDDLAASGPDEQEFVNAYAQVREAYNFVNNGEFTTELLDDAIHPALDLDDYLLAYSALDAVTASSVRSYIADHIRTDERIEVTVVPRG